MKHFMRLQMVTITASYLVALSPFALQGQGPNAAEKTQSSFDEHKAADPTNSDRSLTAKSRQTEARISQVPISSGPSKKTQKRVRDLEKERENFIKDRVQPENEKRSSGANFLALSSAAAVDKANEAWEKTKDGKTLRRLKVEVAEAYKSRERGEARISDLPVPKTTR